MNHNRYQRPTEHGDAMTMCCKGTLLHSPDTVNTGYFCGACYGGCNADGTIRDDGRPTGGISDGNWASEAFNRAHRANIARDEASFVSWGRLYMVLSDPRESDGSAMQPVDHLMQWGPLDLLEWMYVDDGVDPFALEKEIEQRKALIADLVEARGLCERHGLQQAADAITAELIDLED